jgi:hypothetical protein
MSTLQIKLDRVDRIYRSGEVLKGTVIVQSPKGFKHQGISLNAFGVVKLQLSARSVGLLESFYSTLKPIELMKFDIVIAEPGSVERGTTEIAFEFPMKALPDQTLYSTYHGVYVSVCYGLKVECVRGAFKSNLERDMEFIVEAAKRSGAEVKPEPVDFDITPDSLENVEQKSLSSLPHFRVRGRITRSNCPINLPFTGEITIEESKSPIRSISLQLVRVETVIFAEGEAREATEIQNIQLADGDVCRKLVIPIYMIFPRLFTCPSLISEGFKVEYEVNLVVLLQDSVMITENFPIVLYKA